MFGRLDGEMDRSRIAVDGRPPRLTGFTAAAAARVVGLAGVGRDAILRSARAIRADWFSFDAVGGFSPALLRRSMFLLIAF